MKKNTLLFAVEVGEFKIENVQLFNGLYRVYVYKNGTICKVLKAGAMSANQKNLATVYENFLK